MHWLRLIEEFFGYIIHIITMGIMMCLFQNIISLRRESWTGSPNFYFFKAFSDIFEIIHQWLEIKSILISKKKNSENVKVRCQNDLKFLELHSKLQRFGKFNTLWAILNPILIAHIFNFAAQHQFSLYWTYSNFKKIFNPSSCFHHFLHVRLLVRNTSKCTIPDFKFITHRITCKW